MGATVRPRRSVLYMPGSNVRALEKGRGLAADALIMDLEDAVSPDAKAAARAAVLSALGDGGYGPRELIIRVNGLDTPWGADDLAAAATAGAHAVLLPKIESPAMVADAESILVANGAPDDLAIWCMMETPRGILHAEAIATASPRLGALVMGTSDLVKDLHARHTETRLPLLTSLSLCVLAARAHGLAALDGVHLDLADEDGFAAVCAQGAALGFDGKTLIHPKTLAVANRAFAPGEAAVAWSKRIIAAHEDARAAGKGVVLVDGKLIENLHVEEAHRLVALAGQIQALENDAAP